MTSWLVETVEKDFEDEDEVKEHIQNQYIFPFVKSSSNEGDIFVKYSADVKPLIFKELAAKFLSSGNARRRLRALNSLEIYTEEMTENEKICHLLKMTNSVRLVFIPGSPDNLDEKEVKWNITRVDEKGMLIKLMFKNPVYIARDELLD